MELDQLKAGRNKSNDMFAKYGTLEEKLAQTENENFTLQRKVKELEEALESQVSQISQTTLTRPRVFPTRLSWLSTTISSRKRRLLA